MNLTELKSIKKSEVLNALKSVREVYEENEIGLLEMIQTSGFYEFDCQDRVCEHVQLIVKESMYKTGEKKSDQVILCVYGDADDDFSEVYMYIEV